MVDNKNTLEVVRAIQQVVANSFDGAVDKEGKPLEIGLKREKGNPIIHSRIMDGFGTAIQGENLIINYESEVKLEEVQDKNFEQDIEDMIEKISKHIKKEYKNITGETLSLIRDNKKEIKIIVQKISNVRTWVQASCIYKIGNIDLELDKDEHKKKFENNFKEWIEQCKKKPSRPKNEKIKPKDNEKEEK